MGAVLPGACATRWHRCRGRHSGRDGGRCIAMILVAGGTGNLGRCLVQLLLADGLRVRVLSRDPARAARLGDGVDVVAGDVRDPGSLLAAMDGVTTVLSAVHGFAGPGGVTPESVDRLGNFNLIAAATAAGVRRFVLVSITGASAN